MSNEEKLSTQEVTKLDKFKSLFNQAKAKGQQLTEQAKHYGEALDKRIEKSPLKSTVIAGIAGVIIGKLFKKK